MCCFAATPHPSRHSPCHLPLKGKALGGGADRLLGNRFGLGEKFEEGFRLMGPIALSMVGII